MPGIDAGPQRATGKSMTAMRERVGRGCFGATMLVALFGWSVSAAADGGPTGSAKAAMAVDAAAASEPTSVLETPAADRTKRLTIGGRDIVMPVPGGYAIGSERSTEMLDHFQRMQPPENRVLDIFLETDDLRRIEAGMSARHVFYQMMVPRKIESIDVTAADWPTVRGYLRAAMGIDDAQMQKIMESAEDKATERLQQKTGVDVEVKVGRIGQPQIYGDKVGPLKFWLEMPLQLSYEQEVVSTTIAITAVAAVNIRERVFLISASKLYEESNDGAEVRAALDALVAKLETHNAAVSAK